MLTDPQWQLIKAIAHDGEVYAPTSKDFISKHNLGNLAIVLQSLQSLLKMEQVIQETGQELRNFYLVNDLLLRRWVDKR